MSAPLVVVHRDATLLAQAVAARIITGLADAQAARGSASIVLTGGGIGGATLRELSTSPARDAIDWAHLDVWWGDERFLPSGHADRNETQAYEALLSKVPVDPSRVHPMPSTDGPDGEDLDGAAARYADELRAAAHPEDHSPVPAFDILLLGVGPDGHVASLFPEAPALYDERTVIPVRGAPKPPQLRISLSAAAINSAREIWLVAAGEEKAAAVRMALEGAGATQIPASGVKGRAATRWLLDAAAASRIPAGLTRISSP
ncbi:MAG TPA: 6-phosphogluconolactonase [Mycobacteriales bacterium]|nr:6-phosphogluconolactonase [Mycobacteriales bacterium]